MCAFAYLLYLLCSLSFFLITFQCHRTIGFCSGTTCLINISLWLLIVSDPSICTLMSPEFGQTLCVWLDLCAVSNMLYTHCSCLLA